MSNIAFSADYLMRQLDSVSYLTTWYLALHLKYNDALFAHDLYIDYIEEGNRIKFTIGPQSCDCKIKFVNEERHDILTRCLVLIFNNLENAAKKYPEKIRQTVAGQGDN